MASREERELQDVERAMEEELVAEHMQVERVIHLRLQPVDGQQQLKYLVKVRCSRRFMSGCTVEFDQKKNGRFVTAGWLRASLSVYTIAQQIYAV